MGHTLQCSWCFETLSTAAYHFQIGLLNQVIVSQGVTECHPRTNRTLRPWWQIGRTLEPLRIKNDALEELAVSYERVVLK